jgi:zinc protease
MKKGFMALALAVALPALAAELPIPEIPHQKFTLDNGLTLIVHEDHKAPIVAVNVWYHVGSKNEKPGRTGFAHLFEHLMFNGSENYNDDYFKAVEPLGATDLNGTTNNDRTNYFQNVPKSALDTILWLESDRMGHLLGAIDQALLDEQRGVVQNEKRQGDNEPYSIAEELSTKACFPAGHPYSWTVIGSLEDLDAAKLDDVKDWFKTYYGPNNAVLVIAGDINTQDVLAKVKTYFGDIPPGPPVARFDQFVAKRTGTSRQSAQDRVPQTRIWKMWNVPGEPSKDRILLDIAGRLLSSGKSSRFYKRLVYDEQIATRVAAYNDSREIASLFTIEADVKKEIEPAKVERALDEELAKFLANGPTQEELDRARTDIFAGFIRGVERIGGFGGKSDVLAASTVYWGRPDAYKDELEIIRSATPTQVKEAAQKWLSDWSLRAADRSVSDRPEGDGVARRPKDLARRRRRARRDLSEARKGDALERHEDRVGRASCDPRRGLQRPFGRGVRQRSGRDPRDRNLRDGDARRRDQDPHVAPDLGRVAATGRQYRKRLRPRHVIRPVVVLEAQPRRVAGSLRGHHSQPLVPGGGLQKAPETADCRHPA